MRKAFLVAVVCASSLLGLAGSAKAVNVNQITYGGKCEETNGGVPPTWSDVPNGTIVDFDVTVKWGINNTRTITVTSTTGNLGIFSGTADFSTSNIPVANVTKVTVGNFKVFDPVYFVQATYLGGGTFSGMPPTFDCSGNFSCISSTDVRVAW